MTSGLAVFTLIHVVISLIGITTGVVVVQGLLTAHRRDGATAVFLVTTLLTSITGFGFPFEHVLPSHIVGLISIVVLTVALVARYTFRMAGHWRTTYVITAVVGLYFNVFVLIAQLFLKVPALKAIAPTQSEPPFAVAQLVNLVLFIGLGVAAVKRFGPVVVERGGRMAATAKG